MPQLKSQSSFPAAEVESSYSPKAIRSWPQTERPRERLIEKGAHALSDAELLAVLLRNGIRGKNAIEFARELLHQFGGLRGLLSLGWGELKEVKGLGLAKIATLLAAREIARRQLKEELIGKHFARDPQSVLDYLYSALRDKKHEVFKVIFLNKANRILAEEDLFKGTVDETVIHAREIVKAALEHQATGLILVHNHPSGRIQPSPEDREITRKLQSACSTVSVKILDHIIVGDNQYFSFSEHNLLS